MSQKTTHKNFKSHFQKIIEQQRQSVLTDNLQNYDIVCDAYMAAIEKHPNDVRRLTDELSKKIRDFQTKNMSMIPPLVPQEEFESNPEYIERIYQLGGYGYIHQYPEPL